MKVKVTINQLMGLEMPLLRLQQNPKLLAKTTYWINKLYKKLSSELKTARETHYQLIKKYGKLKEGTEDVYELTEDSPDYDQAIKELDEFKEQVVELEGVIPIDFNDISYVAINGHEMDILEAVMINLPQPPEPPVPVKQRPLRKSPRKT